MGQAAAERDEVIQLAEDIERIRRRGESLTTELLKRARPSLRRARVVMSWFKNVQSALNTLRAHRALVAGVLIAGTGVVASVLIHRSRQARAFRKSPRGRVIAFLEGKR